MNGYEIKGYCRWWLNENSPSPSKSLYFKGETCSGGKLCKERLAVFPCDFVTGDMKKPFLIVKATKP
jgi:hypothetical protein